MSVHRCARSNTLLNDDVNGLFCTVCSIASRLNCIPFDYNCFSQRLIVVNSRWRKWMWHLSVSILFLYARFLLVRLFQLFAYLNQKDVPIQFTVPHVILLLFFLAFLTPTAFQINIWIKKHEIVQCFNQVTAASRKQRRRQRSAPASTTWLERVKIIVLPASCYIGSLIMLSVFIIRPEGDQFLFSILPRRYQTWWAFMIFLLLETFAAISVATTIMFQHVIQVVMLQSCSDMLLYNCLLRPWSWSCSSVTLKSNAFFLLVYSSAKTPIENGEFSRMIETYHEQQCLLWQFNHCFAWNIYVFKLVTAIIAVTCSYMLIRSRPYLDSNSYAFIAVCALVFAPLPILLYDQAFKIHMFSDELLYQMKSGIRFLKYTSNRKYFTKKIETLPTLYVKCGSFNFLNRMETLAYIYLVTVYTTKILVSL